VPITVEGIVYESDFGRPLTPVYFQAGQQQGGEFPTDFADELIVGGAVSGTSYLYRDWYANGPPTIDMPIMLPDLAALNALAGHLAYPVDNGGEALELHTAQFDWQATLDKLTWSGIYTGAPIQAKATFTQKQDLGLTAPTGPTTVAAGYVAGVDGLDVDLDLNQGTSSSDGSIDSYDVEWGDSGTSHVTGGPWSIADAEIPIASHTYAAPSPTGADYVVTISVVRNGVTSSDFSTVVTV
jgi:hypothetical protein